MSEGVVLVGTIAFWNYAIDWLSFQFPVFCALCRTPPNPESYLRVLAINLKRVRVGIIRKVAHSPWPSLRCVETVRENRERLHRRSP